MATVTTHDWENGPQGPGFLLLFPKPVVTTIPDPVSTGGGGGGTADRPYLGSQFLKPETDRDDDEEVVAVLVLLLWVIYADLS